MKKKSRFFGLIPERPVTEQSGLEQPAPAGVTVQPPLDPQDASGSLMRALSLTSHADESRLTEQEKRMAWELPARITEPEEALVPRSTSKARLLAPALAQMRQTQATLMACFPAVAEQGNAAVGKTPKTSPDAPGAKNSGRRTSKRSAAPAQQTPEPTPQLAAQLQAAVTASPQPKPVQLPNSVSTQAPPQSATSHGWEYSVLLQRAEHAAPTSVAQPASTPAATSDASDIRLMFQRLRSHSATPPTPPPAAPKAPGFLNKLWAK